MSWVKKVFVLFKYKLLIWLCEVFWSWGWRFGSMVITSKSFPKFIILRNHVGWESSSIDELVCCLGASRVCRHCSNHIFLCIYVCKYVEWVPEQDLKYSPSFHGRVKSCASIEVLQEYVRSFEFYTKLMPFTWIVVRIDGCNVLTVCKRII